MLSSDLKEVVSGKVTNDSTVDVYNFEVASYHNYYVSTHECLTPTQKIASKAANKNTKIFQCIECSDAVKSALQESGLKGDLIELNTGSSKYGNIYSDKLGTNISTNGVHRGVFVDGKVFDNINHNGVNMINGFVIFIQL